MHNVSEVKVSGVKFSLKIKVKLDKKESTFVPKCSNYFEHFDENCGYVRPTTLSQTTKCIYLLFMWLKYAYIYLS